MATGSEAGLFGRPVTDLGKIKGSIHLILLWRRIQVSTSVKVYYVCWVASRSMDDSKLGLVCLKRVTSESVLASYWSDVTAGVLLCRIPECKVLPVTGAQLKL